MKTSRNYYRQIIPATVFLAVIIGHFIWVGWSGSRPTIQEQWVTVAPSQPASWWQIYVDNQSYWLGYPYALSLAFAAYTLIRYHEVHSKAMRNMALGGVTFSGILLFAGCHLIGCCGSPLLIVYLNLFGAAFVPLAKPLIALISTVTILTAWWWLNRSEGLEAGCTKCKD